MDSPDREAVIAAESVAAALLDVLGDDLVAIYLHGSAALGGFLWARSDLDILAVSRTALTEAQFAAIPEALANLGYPANGLEFSLMTAAEAAHPHPPAPRFELHMTTDGRGHKGKVVDGRPHPGDTDLVLHIAVCRAAGIAIFGPPPREVFAEPPRDVVASLIRDEIGWARANAPVEYLVLTAARAWLFVETGRMASKVEAGEWAAGRHEETVVICAALARQQGGDADISLGAAERFANYVERLTGS